MKLMFTVGFIFLCSSSYGQKSHFIADAGISWAHQRIYSAVPYSQVKEKVSLQNIIRPAGGLFYQFQLSDLFALRIGARYIGMGAATKGSSDLNLHYLSTPICLSYAINSKLSISGGPYLSFLLNGSDPYRYSEPINTFFSRNDFGAVFGLEHKLYKKISIGACYYLGLKNIYLFDERVTSLGKWTTKYTNRSFQFSLLYKLKFNSK